jgi:hypothetical protein
MNIKGSGEEAKSLISVSLIKDGKVASISVPL